MRLHPWSGAALLLALSAALPPLVAAEPEPVVVYSSRNEHLIRPLFEAYTEETGIPVQFITDAEGPLIQRLVAEGEGTRADLLLTVDAGNLWAAAERGLLQPVSSTLLDEAIPGHLRDPEGRWFGLSVRARTLVHSSDLAGDELVGYADLADPRWEGRLCLRTSKKVYNQSLVAMLIAEHGEAQAEQIVRGWVANLAAPPFANDTAVMEAILAGQCEVGIVNSYYFGRLQRDDPELPLQLFWADQDGRGVHVNVSGAGLVRHAPNPEGGRQLLEWLASTSAQRIYASANLEYPADPRVDTDPLVAAWGSFEQNGINLSRAGELQARAVMLMERAGYR